MKRVLFLAFVFLLGCSKDDSEGTVCNCETILFRAVININNNQYDEFTRTHCVSYWDQPGFTVDVDRSKKPVTITGPNQSTVDIAINKSPCD